jgi:hypothetical protein
VRAPTDTEGRFLDFHDVCTYARRGVRIMQKLAGRDLFYLFKRGHWVVLTHRVAADGFELQEI